MAKIRIQFATEKWDLASGVIRWFTWSDFSHVDFVLPAGLKLPDGTESKGGELLGARVGKDGANKAGVQVRHPGYAKFTETVQATIEGPIEIYLTALSQVGKPYDWRAILNFAVHNESRNWQETDSWICSEYVTWSCWQHGIYLVNAHIPMNRVTPRDVSVSNLVMY